MLAKTVRFLKNDRNTLLISIISALIFAVLFRTAVFSKAIQSDIADKIIRFHVLANSDSYEDQQLKLIVKDGIIDFLSEGLRDSDSLEQTRHYINNNLDAIKRQADMIISEQGYGCEAAVSLGVDYFPTRYYGDVTLPPGLYNTLRVEIGEADGKNWWCVMFPPLCLVDVTKKVVPDESRTQLKNILTEEEYKLVLYKNGKGVAPSIKFKIVEIWQSLWGK